MTDLPLRPKSTTRRKKGPQAGPPLEAGLPQAPVPESPDAPRPAPQLNPNRLSFPRAEDLHASRLINPDALNLSAQDRRRTSGRQPKTTISVLGVSGEKTKSERLQVAGTYSVGLCIREGERMRFMHYPSGETLDDVLPHVLETAVKYVPALSDVTLSTPHRMLWDRKNHTEATGTHLRDFGLNLKPRHPLPGDMGSVLARMSAMGLTGPVLVDYHLYTASLTDESRTYAAALLWTRGFAVQFIQTFEHADLARAEAVMAEWGFKQMHPTANVMIHNANPTIGQIWKKPHLLGDSAYADVRDAMRGVGKQIKLKNIHFSNKERPHDLLMQSVRDLAAGRYVRSNVRER